MIILLVVIIYVMGFAFLVEILFLGVLRQRLRRQEMALRQLHGELRYWQDCAGSLGQRVEELMEYRSDLHAADWWKEEGDE